MGLVATPPFPKHAQKRNEVLTLRALVGTVRCWRSLHWPRHRPIGTGLSSGTMPASLIAAAATRAPDHLSPAHARSERRLHEDSMQRKVHTELTAGPPASRLHSLTCTECSREAKRIGRLPTMYLFLHGSHDFMHLG